MLSQNNGRPIRALALLLALLSPFLAGIAGLLMVPPARADELKLDGESYLIPSADPAFSYTSATSIRPA